MISRPHNTPAIDGRKWAVALGIVVLLSAIYFLTYRGYAISRDEWFLFDATESMARRGSLEQNYEYDAFPPIRQDMVTPPPADTEPLQPALAASLFLLAQALPGIGLAHTTWLFNILFTALTAGLVYLFGISLGYRLRAAAIVALIFGLGTIAWPYSHTYFREPLFTFLALLAVYLMMIVRRRLENGHHIVLVGTALATVLAGILSSKEAAVLLVPALAVEAWPSRLDRLRFSRRTLILGISFLVVLIFMTAIALTLTKSFSFQRYAFDNRLAQARNNLAGAAEGIRGYMLSPGRSIWLYSPGLLPGLWGIVLLARARRWRQIIVPLAVLSTFTVVYAAVRGERLWAGGFGWGARYLVPVTPFLALLLLPVIAALLDRRSSRWQWLVMGGLVLVSIGLQMLASLISLHTFYATLTIDELAAYDDIWVWTKSPIPGYLDLAKAHLTGTYIIDWAWQYAIGDAWLLPVLCIVLASAALGWLVWWLNAGERTSRPGRTFVLMGISLALLTTITFGGGLYAIRHDQRYSGDFQPARDLLAQLTPQLETNDVVVLHDATYAEFFMNYYKQSSPTIYTLAPSPGERYSPEQAPQIDAVHPDEGIRLTNTLVFAHFAGQTERLWLVINSSRFVPWSTRPVEAYLARHYFPVQEVNPSDLARAVLFDLTSAPPTPDLSWPEYPVNVTYGDQVHLVGYDLPGGTSRQAGDVLPVSLLWEALTPVANDYTVALFLFAEDGSLVTQHDAFPMYYFDPMTAWRPGSLHRDNHGLPLPDTLPPGEYELWAVLYFWQTPNSRLNVTGPDGSSIGDHAVLTTITIN